MSNHRRGAAIRRPVFVSQFFALLLALLPAAAQADHTGVPTTVTAPGSFQSELGCPGDWQPECLNTELTDPDGDGTYTLTTTGLPAGNYEAKVAHNQSWDENYGAGGVRDGPNIPFAVGVGNTVTFSYDLVTHVLTIDTASGGYAIIHYYRDDGDYGDHTTGDYNDFWGLHLWGDGLAPEEFTDWTSPRPFLGETDYGRFAWIRLNPAGGPVNFIIHRGDTKDGTNADRSFDPANGREIWTRQDDGSEYPTQARAQGFARIHYHRDDGDYGAPSPDYNSFWGLHLWGDAIDPAEITDWTSPKPFDGVDDYGAYWTVLLQDPSQPLNFIIHRGDAKDPGPDQSFVPDQQAAAWIQSGDFEVYPQRGAAEKVATIHYHRPDGNYGDFTSNDFNDFWGLHVWDGAANPNPAWQQPVKPAEIDTFGPAFEVDIVPVAPGLAYILHRGDAKDPGPDQFLQFDAWGYEVWQLSGADPAEPYVLPLPGNNANPGNIGEQRAYWVDEETIAWEVADDPAHSYSLHYAPDGGLQATADGITGGTAITLTPGEMSDASKAKFPHLADLPALKIGAGDLPMVPAVLKSQIAVSAVDGDGQSVNATGLQIPGVLDDLYTYGGDLGVVFSGDTPSVHLWAPTARAVDFHLFDNADPATGSTGFPMTLDPATGVWSIAGTSDWTGKYYLFEVEVYVHSTGAVENNLVTDPYSFNLSMNSARSQLVDLADDALKPAGWDSFGKPPLAAPEDIAIWELHVRDFSASDPSVPDELKGTYQAFALAGSNGRMHLGNLAAAGLTHIHLLPAFDIATVNENKSEWMQPDPADLASYAPDSTMQQAEVTTYENVDAFNWGYDPWHYTAPDGSYATDPNGPARIVEFREMVKALNEAGLRVVMDVVYNHTTASGQNDKSVLDRVVPGYYHRLNETGGVETSTCCDNTASEHAMMEKLMIDSIVTWALAYKVDGFRFDLMGHHSKQNMLNLRAALDALTLGADGVDGESIYIYGEGWNFGEVADNARFVQATQRNMAGTGIGTFSDRLRDAVRGGGPFSGLQEQGFATGLSFDSNGTSQGNEAEELLFLQDLMRNTMAGQLLDYAFEDRNGNVVTGAQLDYFGQPAGYTADPQEVIVYASAHDNETMFDAVQLKVPGATSVADRVRAQNVAVSAVALSQGVPFFHAGMDMLRSKSMDRDSFNSGDWFNRLDFTYESNNWGGGLPVASKNAANWGVMQPLLADPGIVPESDAILAAVHHFREMLEIRKSSPLFRLRTADEIIDRLSFHNTGPGQTEGLIVMSLADTTGALDPTTEGIVVLINAGVDPVSFARGGIADLPWTLHPVLAASADPIARTSTYDGGADEFNVPARTTAVFVGKRSAEDQIDLILDLIDELEDDGVLSRKQADWLRHKPQQALKQLAKGHDGPAANQMENFIVRVQELVRRGVLTEAEGDALIEAANNVIDCLDQ